MDFYANNKNASILSFVLLIVALLLLFLNVFNLCFKNELHSYFGIVSSALVALCQGLKIRTHNKEKKS